MYDGLGPASIANPHVLASDPHFTGGGLSALLAPLIRMKLALVLHYFLALRKASSISRRSFWYSRQPSSERALTSTFLCKEIINSICRASVIAVTLPNCLRSRWQDSAK